MFVLKTLGGIALGATLAAGAVTGQGPSNSVESTECACCDSSTSASVDSDCCASDPAAWGGG
ncbi:MAG: hypothetical protein AAGB93_11875, partial [Planctomycetota bacterium]